MRRALTWLYGRPYLLLIFTMLMWGGNAVASRLAVGEVSPMALTFLRGHYRSRSSALPFVTNSSQTDTS